MFNVFIIGEEPVKKELTGLIGNNSIIQSKPDEYTHIVFDLNNFPMSDKASTFSYIDDTCSGDIPIFTSSLCFAAFEQSIHTSYPERLVGAGFYDTFSKASLIEIAPTKITSEKILSTAEEFLKINNIKFTKVPDRPGLVFPRILAMIINEAAQVYSEDIASRDDIDTAMKLGTNYPLGPLEWADKLGIDLVYNILLNLQRFFGEDRYRPHPSLKEMVDLKMHGIRTGRGFYSY